MDEISNERFTSSTSTRGSHRGSFLTRTGQRIRTPEDMARSSHWCRHDMKKKLQLGSQGQNSRLVGQMNRYNRLAWCDCRPDFEPRPLILWVKLKKKKEKKRESWFGRPIACISHRNTNEMSLTELRLTLWNPPKLQTFAPSKWVNQTTWIRKLLVPVFLQGLLPVLSVGLLNNGVSSRIY